MRTAMPRFNLETAIATWRQFHAYRRVFLNDDLDELERHLRDFVTHQQAEGMDDEAAFRAAVDNMGDFEGGRAEYEKVYWGKRRRQHTLTDEFYWRLAMLKNYLTVALRNLRKQKGYSFINITGLAVGLAASFFIFLWVQDELQHDRFLEQGDQIHQVKRHVNIGGDIYTWTSTSKPLAEVLETEYPAIEEAVHSLGDSFIITSGTQNFRESGTHASADFFNVFALPFLQGNPETALSTANSAVITDRMARRLFGDDWQQQGNVLGQPLTINHRKEVAISAVIADPPRHSSFQSDVIIPIQELFDRNPWVEQWGNNSFPLYVKLAEDASASAVSEQIAGVVMAHEEGANEQLFLQPYEDMYLHGEFENGELVGGRIVYVRIFSIVAVFLLLIACINFMNLATARAAKRAREIGVRKAVGANQGSLITQFLGEALLLAGVAFLLALGTVAALLPLFNTLTTKSLSLGALGGSFWLGGFALAMVVGLLAGSYPALYLSSLHPLVVLRNTFRPGSRAALLRKSLVVFQFGLSMLLITGTVAVYQQMDYLRSKNIGLDRENIIALPQEGALQEQFPTIKQALLSEPSIANVTAVRSSPLEINSSTGGVTWEGKDPEAVHEFYIMSVAHDFIETMRMEMVAGRAFGEAFGADSAGFLINEETAQLLGEEVIGTTLSFWRRTGPVIGVVKNFDMNSLYEPEEPVVIMLSPSDTRQVYVRTQPGQTAEALATLEATVQRFNPEYPFDYSFLDEEFEATYRSETVMGRLANIFAFIAIFISCLGLFGLVAFTTEQRTKEIGVRKVLGASVPTLVRLLTSEVTRLVLLGIVIALPVAYVLVQRWLDHFADHITLGVGVFVGAGAIALVIAWLTVSYQSVKAALADPVKSLRYE